MANKETFITYQLIYEPDDALKCMICLGLAEEPWQHGKCGKLFCKKCLEKYGKSKHCPNCRTKLPQYLEDGKSKREIQALQVMCGHCEWIGSVGTIQKHMSSCKSAPVPCPKECRDDSGKVRLIVKRDLNRHLEKSCPNRDYTCDHCGEKGTYANITGVHGTTCSRKVIPCLNSDCSATMERWAVNKHLEKCKHTVVPCKYSNLGCGVVLKRKDMPEHEENADKLHLRMVLGNMSKAKSHLITFKSTTYPEDFTSPSFYTDTNSYHMSVEIHHDVDEYYARDGFEDYVSLSFYIHVLKGDHDGQLKWPLTGKLTVTLLNQLEDKNHLQKTVHLEKQHAMQVGQTHTCSRAVCHVKVGYDPERGAKYFEDETLDMYYSVAFESAEDKPWLQCYSKHPG